MLVIAIPAAVILPLRALNRSLPAVPPYKQNARRRINSATNDDDSPVPVIDPAGVVSLGWLNDAVLAALSGSHMRFRSNVQAVRGCRGLD